MQTILIAHNYSEVSFAAMSYHLAHYLADKGHRVVFISHQPYFDKMQVIPKGKGELIIYSWPSRKRPTGLSDFLWYAKIHWKYRPKIIVGHFVGSNITITVSKCLSFGRVRTFEYYHTLTNQLLTDHKKIDLKQRLLFFRKKMFYKILCDTLVCPSDMARSDAKQFYTIDKAVVLLNPMLDRFSFKKVLSTDSIVVSYLGRLDPSKGVVDLVAAYLKYKGQVPETKIVLQIAGSGAQLSEIQEMIKDTVGIHYVGGLAYDGIDAYLSQSHFAIIPSKFDNLPTVGIESMMNQTPLLLSNTTGLTPYLTAGKECFKFDATQIAMVELFAKVEDSISFQEQMGKEARATFLEKFSMDRYCETFYTLLK
jgi:glycosyltransferase involved in cell wall biosynthesis